MAIMIPSTPNEYVPESREGDIFESLKKLSDNYYVFHSLKIKKVTNNIYYSNEIDFVVFNKYKGILCIEAKAGSVSCEQGVWYYASGVNMRNPFEQVESNKWKLSKRIEDICGSNVLKKCKILGAVWFPSLENSKLSKINLPIDATKEMILTAEDLVDPTKKIESIFDIEMTKGVNKEKIITSLDKETANEIMQNVLCPKFKILPSKTFELDYKREVFSNLLSEQYNLLNYLEEQRSAVINGAAGTGKTMIAVEKARRHSINGDKVLFLCYNTKLREYLEKTYAYKNVDYFNIDKYVCKVCNTVEPNYASFAEKLIDTMSDFEYDHVIIDEGQDFGQDRMNIDDIFFTLEEIVLSKENGTFYVFYDKHQLVQGSSMPNFINNADCRLTLYKNCRNTRRIAETSMKPLKIEPKMFDSVMQGNTPNIYFVDKSDSINKLNNIIDKSIVNGLKDIQILSCAPSGSSIFEDNVEGDFYISNGRKVPFTTCRKFKGLEADNIILVDVNEKTLMNYEKVFYVGSSRARFELSILANINDSECSTILNSWGRIVKRNNPKSSLAKDLGCKNVED